MKKYPYIGKGKHSGAVFLFVGEDTALTMHQGVNSRYSTFETDINEGYCTNITREYLQNTWGVVESKEHAEFIIEIAELHGYSLDDDYKIGNFFFISETKCGFSGRGFCSDGAKQITIPLPPKVGLNHSDKKLTPDEIRSFYNSDIHGNELPEAGHNLIFAASECKEWPCVNDKAEYGTGVIVTVIATDGEYAWVSCRPSDREKPCTVKISELQKPKTPEEDLRDDLTRVMQRNLTYKQIIDDLIENFNITKKPQ